MTTRGLDLHLSDDLVSARLTVYRMNVSRPGLWTPAEAFANAAREAPWLWADDLAFCPEGRRSTPEELARKLPPQEEAA